MLRGIARRRLQIREAGGGDGPSRGGPVDAHFAAKINRRHGGRLRTVRPIGHRHALEARMAKDQIEAVVRRDTGAMNPSTWLGFQFADAVASRAANADRHRDAVRAQWGEKGVIDSRHGVADGPSISDAQDSAWICQRVPPRHRGRTTGRCRQAGPRNGDPLAPYRGRLLGLAYRMLGSRSDAEDVVQDAYLRFAGAQDVRNTEAFLVTIVTRLCLDRLKSAKVQREGLCRPLAAGTGVSMRTAFRRIRRPNSRMIFPSRSCWRWTGCRRLSAPRSCFTTCSTGRFRKWPRC